MKSLNSHEILLDIRDLRLRPTQEYDIWLVTDLTGMTHKITHSQCKDLRYKFQDYSSGNYLGSPIIRMIVNRNLGNYTVIHKGIDFYEIKQENKINKNLLLIK